MRRELLMRRNDERNNGCCNAQKRELSELEKAMMYAY